MIIIHGRAISGGNAAGRLHCYHRVGAAAVKRPGMDPEQEKYRLAQAQERAKDQLERLASRCRREVAGKAAGEAALVFSTHAMLLDDENFLENIQETLERENCCAEYAVQMTGEKFADIFETMEDPYMRERGADVMDVAWRLLRNLAGAGAGAAELDAPAIIAANNLNPSEFIGLDRHQVLAIVTRQGSENSHAAILARLLNIPTICGLGDQLRADYHGRLARVDGLAGTLTVY